MGMFSLHMNSKPEVTMENRRLECLWVYCNVNKDK